MSEQTLWAKLVQKLKTLTDVTFWKFLLVGIANTLIGAGVMFACYNWLDFSYWLSSALNYVVGSIVSYILNKIFTFKSKEKAYKDIWKFILVVGVCYVISYVGAERLMLLILSDASVTVRDNISMLVGMGFYLILNYIGQRFFVFKKTEKEGEAQSNNGEEEEKTLPNQEQENLPINEENSSQKK